MEQNRSIKDKGVTIADINDKGENVSNNPESYYFQDCGVEISAASIQENQSMILFKLIKSKIASRRNNELQGKLTLISGLDNPGFDNSDLRNATFDCPYHLKYNRENNKLYISDYWNHIIRSISDVFLNDENEWDGKSEIEVGQPEQEGYSNGDRITCKLNNPVGFDWDKNNNMYICSLTCVCKVDSQSNQVSLVAGHATDEGFKDGINGEARFDGLKGILCFQQNHDQLSPAMYVCDSQNGCIRTIDITNDRTTTFAGKGEEKGDTDGTLQSARFNSPFDIAKDDKNVNILYVCELWNHKIKMIDMEKGMVTTLVGDKNDKSILNKPIQMQIIDPFIYVTCDEFKDCIVRIDKITKGFTKIKFIDEKQVTDCTFGIAYHDLDQCFYISDYCNVYKLE